MNRLNRVMLTLVLSYGSMQVVESAPRREIDDQELMRGGAAAGAPVDILPGQVNSLPEEEMEAEDFGVTTESPEQARSQAIERLIDAVWRGDITRVKELLAMGLDINGHGYAGWTALHAAAYKGHREIVDFLLASPLIDVNARKEYRETPLMCAARGEGDGIVARLLQAGGIEVNAQDSSGWTALHLAARLQGTEEDMEALLNDERINWEIRTTVTGETALHVAAYWDNINHLRALLEKGADVNATTASGQTALQLTRDSDCSVLLKSYGGRSRGCMSWEAFCHFFRR